MKSNQKRLEDLHCETLVIRARLGQAEAFEQLVSALESPMFYYVRRLVGNEDDAWDVLQEIWIKAFRGLRSLRETNRFRGWLYGIAHQTVLSRMRIVYRERRYFEPIPPGETAEEAYQSPDLEDPTRVHAALDELDLPFREVLTLHFLDELSVEETARAIGIPAGTVKSRLFHAKRALKKTLIRTKNL